MSAIDINLLTIGRKGTPGTPGLNPRGAWEAGTYNARDLVTHENSTWVAERTTTVEPDDDVPLDWTKYVDGQAALDAAAEATTKAGEAASSASAASTSAATATTQAGNAAGSASTATTQASNAVNSASAAASSASAAQTAQANAEQAEANAELAATQATAASPIYEDTTAGLAAVSEGDYFSVEGDDANTFAILYREESGVAVERKRYPSKAALDAVAGGTFSEQFATAGFVAPAATSSNLNDYNPAGWDEAVELRLEFSVADRHISGIAGGAEGRYAIITNKGATNNFRVRAESAFSTAANRFALLHDMDLRPGESLHLKYDDVSERWRPVGIDYGDRVARYLTVGGTASALACTSNVTPMRVYRAGNRIAFVPASACTGATTIVVDVAGTVNLLGPDGAALPAGAFPASRMISATYDGSAFRLDVDPYDYIDRENQTALGRQDQPGESPRFWTSTPESGLASRTRVATSAVLNSSTQGLTEAAAGAKKTGPFAFYRINPGRLLRHNIAVQLTVGDADSANNKYSFGIACFTNAKVYISTYYPPNAQDIAIATADGRVTASFELASTVSGVPSTTVYYTPFVQAFGTTGRLRVEWITPPIDATITDALAKSSTVTRPGDNVEHFTTAPESAGYDATKLRATGIVNSPFMGAAEGTVGARKIGRYAMERLRDGRRYILEPVVQLTVNDAIPANNKWSLGLACFNKDKAYLGTFYLAENVTIAAADGVVAPTYELTSDTAGVISGTIYVRPFLQSYGTTGRLWFEEIPRLVDATNFGGGTSSADSSDKLARAARMVGPLTNFQDWDTASEAGFTLRKADDLGSMRTWRKADSLTGLAEDLRSSASTLQPWDGFFGTNQSNGLGSDDGADALNLTAKTPYYALSFNGDNVVADADDGVLNGASLTDFQGIRGSTVLNNDLPLSIAMQYAALWCETEAGVKRRTFFGAVSGEGSTKLSDRDAGSTSFTNSVTQVTRADAIATTFGPGLIVRGVLEIGGETERTDDISISSYKTTMATYITDINTAYKAATGQSQDIPVYFMQVCGIADGTGPQGLKGAGLPALAQYEIAEENALARLVTGCYAFPLGSSNIHRTPEGHHREGEQAGKAMVSELVTGVPWEPLKVTDALLDGTTVTLTTNRYSLAIEAAVVPLRTNYGFTYGEDSGSSGIAIESVTLVQGDEDDEEFATIVIELDGEPEAADDPYIDYAYTSSGEDEDGHSAAWGNIVSRTDFISFFFEGETVDDWLATQKMML